jgi:hypothetical protein
MYINIIKKNNYLLNYLQFQQLIINFDHTLIFKWSLNEFTMMQVQ